MKKLLMAFAILLAILLSLFLYQIYRPGNPLTADLASPSQEKRDAAAKVLRAIAKPPSKLKWLFFTWHIKKGESEANILELLRSYNLSTDAEGGLGGIGEYREYRLDDYWLLGCELNNNDYENVFLEQWKFVPRWRDFYFRPTTNYSGAWITYFANGRESSEAIYTNGNFFGESIIFSPNGSTNNVYKYDHGKLNGSWIQYYPSGRIQFQGQFSDGIQVGIRVSYNEDGTTNFIKDFSKP